MVLALAYTSYITAELFHLSGIISLTCCGLLQIGYSNHNVSKKSKTTIKYVTKTLSSMSDVIIFLHLGMVLLGHSHIWNLSFFVFTIVFCVVYRFMGTLQVVILFIKIICFSFVLLLFSCLSSFLRGQ